MKTIVSIIVPCYNQAEYLDECLLSVLNQTFQDWECIIVNDGSTDTTEEVVTEWIKKDNRFKYIFISNSGVSKARNIGIQSAIGEFILPLDADDKIADKYISLALESFTNHNDIKIVYCKAEKFGAKNEKWDLPHFSLKTLAKYNIIFCSALFKKEEWKRVGGYDDDMKTGLEDWEFWIAILKNGGNVKCLDYFGFFYRIKEDSRQKRVDNNALQRVSLIDYVSIKHADFFISQFGNFISLNDEINNYKHILKSKRFTLKLFLNNFFGINLFKK